MFENIHEWLDCVHENAQWEQYKDPLFGDTSDFSVIDTDDGFVYQIPLAGYSREDITVENSSDGLTVTAICDNPIYQAAQGAKIFNLRVLEAGDTVEAVQLRLGILTIAISRAEQCSKTTFEIT